MKQKRTSVQTEQKPVGQESNEREQAKENRRILIVEDEIEILKAYQDILGPKNNVIKLKSSRSFAKSPDAPGELSTSKAAIVDGYFEVEVASSGEVAIQMVTHALKEKKPYAMGFFDVLLGSGIDGIETVKRIHLIDPDMYSILVTAYQDRHVNSIQEIFGPEFQDRWDYLNKPFSEGEILQKARNMVSMWNIRLQKIEDQIKIDEMQRKINDSERHMAIAAVARGVGHEFGNILLQIMGRADLARTGPEAEMKTALETILAASEHAAKVLSRFKSLASPAEVSVEEEMISLLEPLDDTLRLMDHELKRKKIQTLIHFDPLPTVMGNRTGIVQVFMNLTINAMHAIGDKGGTIEFHGTKCGNFVQILVRDSGTGIPPENLDSVFHTFFTTKGHLGTGLGLSICKEVIEINHAGKISVRNHENGGAEFKILIPINREREGV